MSADLYLKVAPFLQSLVVLSLQATVLVLLVLLVQRIFLRQLTARWRFLMWWIVLICLLVPIRPPSSFSLANLYPQIDHPMTDGTELLVLTVPGNEKELEKHLSDVEETIIPRDRSEMTSEPLTSVAPPVVVSQPGSIVQVRGDAMTEDKALHVTVTGPMALLFYFWMLGVCALVGHLLFLMVRFHRSVSTRCQVVSGEAKSIFDECRHIMDVRRNVELLETDALQSPSIYGLFRLQLLLPKGLATSFSEAELRHIFLHELAHVKRGDMWLNWLVTGLQIIHWFNPFIWLAFARLRADRELACDELALIYSGEMEGRNYGQTILKLLENISQAKPIPGLVGIVEDRQQMAERLKRIASFRLPTKWSGLAAVLLLALGLVGLTGAQAPSPAVVPAASEVKSTGKNLDTPSLSTNLMGKVLLPDGQLASGAKVTTRGFGAGNLFDFQTAETDGKGSFSLPDEKGVLFVMVSYPQGFAQIKVEDFRAQPVIRLEPWGRVEGTLAVEAASRKGGYLKLSPLLLAVANGPVLVNDSKFYSVLESTGRYTFENIPPGEYRVLWAQSPPPHTVSRPHIETIFSNGALMGFVRVEAGKTTVISPLPQGQGLTVKAKLVLPESSVGWDWSKVQISGRLISTSIREIFKADSFDFKNPHWESETYWDSQLKFRDYSQKNRAGGEIIFENVTPGEYSLLVVVFSAERPAQTAADDMIVMTSIGGVERAAVLIPEKKSSDQAEHDLGELILTKPAVKTSAPAQSEKKSTSDASAQQPATSTEAAQLRVRVLDNDSGQPLSEATVRNGRTVATTDKDGYASVPKPAASNAPFMYEIRIRRSGYAARELKWSSLQQDKQSDIPDEYTTRLDKGRTIGGQVRDETGKGIPEATVEISGPSRSVMMERERLLEGHAFAKVTTDAQGKWIFNQAPKKFEDLQFFVTHPQYEKHSYRIDLANEPTTGPLKLRMADLASMNAVMTLKAGIAISGRVVDEAGNPVAGVRITINQQWNESTGNITNGADGRFHISNASGPRFVIDGLPPKTMALTLQATGYASKMEAIPLDPPPKEFSIVMLPGRTLRGIVMNTDGTTITNGFFAVDSPTGMGQRPYSFTTRTDAEGRLVWTSAPVEPITASLSAPGYLPQRVTNWVADGVEKKVILTRASNVSSVKVFKGRVFDAVTKQPIKDFYLQWEALGASSIPNPTRFTSENYRMPVSFSGNSIKATFTASGYQPLITTFTTAQLEKDQDVFLEPGKDYEGKVLLPDGTPAIGASVVFSTARFNATVGDRRFITYNGPKAIDVDNNGVFRHPQTGGCLGIAAAHEQGVAMVSPEEFKKNPVIRLQPWGRVEGQLQIGEKIGAGEDMWLRTLGTGSGNNLELSGARFSTKTDAAGRFVFEYVPPGEYKIFRIVKAGPVVPVDDSLGQAELLAKSHGGSFSHDTVVVVAPGQKVNVSLGGKGALVRAKVFMPEKAPFDWAGTSLFARLEKSPVQWPWQVEKRAPKPGENVQYMRTEAYRSAAKARQEYAFSVNADGSISVYDVPPGNYRLELRVERKLDPNSNVVFRGPRMIAGFTNDVVVIPAGKLTDLGELMLIKPEVRLLPQSNSEATNKK
ncbi:MAG TPA: M56 family metallopeptidase [Verrucomicrobiae bacterium]